MLSHLICHASRLIRQLAESRSMGTRRRRQVWGNSIDALEPGPLLTVRVWDGGAILNDRVSDKDNWVGDVAPKANDDLAFPGNSAITMNLPLVVNDDEMVFAKSNSVLAYAGSSFTVAGLAINARPQLEILQNFRQVHLHLH